MDNVCNCRLFSFPAKVEMAEEQEYSIFSDEIFCVIMTLKFWPPCWCPKVGHQDCCSIHLLLKVSNTHLPLTLKRNAFGLQNLAKICRFKPSTIP